MNLKATLLLFLVFFALATTTIVTVFDAPTPHVSPTTENMGYKIESDNVQPVGDPVDSPWAPD